MKTHQAVLLSEAAKIHSGVVMPTTTSHQAASPPRCLVSAHAHQRLLLDIPLTRCISVPPHLRLGAKLKRVAVHCCKDVSSKTGPAVGHLVCVTHQMRPFGRCEKSGSERFPLFPLLPVIQLTACLIWGLTTGSSSFLSSLSAQWRMFSPSASVPAASPRAIISQPTLRNDWMAVSVLQAGGSASQSRVPWPMNIVLTLADR